jgi:hypothetical protein
MTKYSNQWTDGSKTVRSDTRPSEYHYPVYAQSRVNGANYTPYEAKHGSAEWVKAANKAMASHARGNFETQN